MDIKNKRKTITIGVILVIISVILTILINVKSKGFLSSDGDSAYFRRENYGNKESISLSLEITGKGVSKKKNVILNFSDKKGKNNTPKHESEEEEINREIRQLINSIENQKGKEIKLPCKSKKGYSLKWSKELNLKPLILPVFYPALIYSFYVSNISKEKKKTKSIENKIKLELPEFNNRLVLLLNSGLVFSDAFYRIVESYNTEITKVSPLRSLVIEIYKESQTGEESLITVFDRKCRETGIKELNRISGIIVNHQYTGGDLREKLQKESEILWEGRKQYAELQGKLGETKLSFPLAILLIVLIMITTAPAVLEM